MPNNPYGKKEDQETPGRQNFFGAGTPVRRHSIFGGGKTFGVRGNMPEAEDDLQDIGIPGAAALEPRETGIEKAGRLFGKVAKFFI